MKWLLLVVVMGTSAVVSGQSTLKIFVTNDDERSDMVIIDMNTSALSRYGNSIDSTNVAFYTTTMSTQVIRMTYEELFGIDDSEVVLQAEMVADDLTQNKAPRISELEAPTASIEGGSVDIVNKDKTKSNLVEAIPQSQSRNSNYVSKTKVKPTENRSFRMNNPKRKTIKRVRLKKSKRSVRYKGQCPKFF